MAKINLFCSFTFGRLKRNASNETIDAICQQLIWPHIHKLLHTHIHTHTHSRAYTHVYKSHCRLFILEMPHTHTTHLMAICVYECVCVLGFKWSGWRKVKRGE